MLAKICTNLYDVFTILSSGLVDGQNEVELQSKEESSESESESEELSVSKATALDSQQSNEQNKDPLPNSSPAEDEPSLEPANNQPTAVSEEEANKSLTATEEVNLGFCLLLFRHL